jgi:hypothetical protein
LIAGVVAVGLLPAAPAAGSPLPAGAVALRPPALSAGSQLEVVARGTDAGFRNGQLPDALAIAFQTGFRLRPGAASATCTVAKANDDACPAASVLGTGSIDVVLSGARYVAGLQFFRAADGVIFYFKEKESGFNGASLGTVRAAAQAPYGPVLAFDKLPLPVLPPGLDLRLDRLVLDLGTAGRKGRCTRYRGKGPKRRCVKRAKPPGSFVTNPSACAGTWAIQLRWGYRNGEELREGAARCPVPVPTPPPR